jgi:DNA-binding beta-propeller fold protein YncE
LKPFSNNPNVLASNNPAGALMMNMTDSVTFGLPPVNFNDTILGIDYSTLPGDNNGTWKGFVDGFQNDNFFNFSVEQETSEKWLYRNWDAQDSHPFHFHLTSGYTDVNDPYNTLPLVSNNNYLVQYTYTKDTYSIGSQTQLSWYLKFNNYNGTSYPDANYPLDPSGNGVIGNLGYMYHCHFMTHHDMMMMGQYFVTPKGSYQSYFGGLTPTVYIPGISLPKGLHSDGKFVWVTNDASGVVQVIQINGTYNSNPNIVSRPQITSTINLQTGAVPLQVSTDVNYVWVSDNTNGKVYQINKSTLRVVNVTSVPGAFGISSDGTYIWVTNGNSANTVTQLDVDGNILSTHTLGGGLVPRGVRSDGTYVWVANQGSSNVTKLDALTGVVIGSPIAVGTAPIGISSDGTYVWVANQVGSTVTQINCSTGTVVNTITVGAGSSGISSDGTYVWVTNLGNSTVSQIECSTSVVKNTISIAGGVNSVSSDGNSVWVSTANNKVAQFQV